MKDHLVKKEILGVGVSDASSDGILEYVFTFLKNTREKMYIVTPNPEIVMYSRRHPEFRDTLNRAGVALCDGVGLFMAGKFLGQRVRERISGVDFMENLCRLSVEKAVTVGFLGGKKNVAERTAKCLMERYPGLQVSFVGEEWLEEGFARIKKYKGESIKYKAREREPLDTDVIDILFVAFGFPKQELWLAENLDKLPVRVMMGVGGAFDYLSGDVSRAPRAMRSLGLEWLYRLIRQPWRLKRQLVLPQFVLLVLKERFS